MGGRQPRCPARTHGGAAKPELPAWGPVKPGQGGGQDRTEEEEEEEEGGKEEGGSGAGSG